MPDYTVKIDLPDTKRGDKWPGIATIGPVLINAAQPAAALTRVRMRFKIGARSYILDSDNSTSPAGPIIISNPTTWLVAIPAVQSFLPVAGQWSWDMEFYSTGDTSPLTLYKGDITVHPDV